MNYVDGYVIPVHNSKRQAYIDMAKMMAPIFKQYGALGVTETWGNDVPEGKLTSFPMAVKLEKDETVVFSWIVWPSKEVRDVGMKKVFEDPRMGPEMATSLFDGKRMIFGGFEVVVQV